MTDKQIDILARDIRKYVEDLLMFGIVHEIQLNGYEVDDIATEVERAFVKSCYLIEFKQMRAKEIKQ